MFGEHKARTRFAIVIGVSILLLLPCFWQSRIQAGDLSSHIYNAWLVELIQQGRVQGLTTVPLFTNVLFDLVLSAVLRVAGSGAAQRVAVSLSVLVFVWGAFAFAAAVSRRRPWHVLPFAAMLAYGWVFHMGFFNFHLSLGLCLWALAALWRPSLRRILAGGAILVVAVTAHALPVAWTLGLVTYTLVARRVPARYRPLLTGGCVVLLAAVNRFVAATYFSSWTPQQIAIATGADQVWVFGEKYGLVMIGLVAGWCWFLARLWKRRGKLRIALGLPFQLCVLSAAVVVAIPNTVMLPMYRHGLAYIPERMSLATAVCVCALLAAVPARLSEQAAMWAVASVFFLFVYADERALNRFEDRIDEAVAGLPHFQRVFTTFIDQDSRIDGVYHMLDRACIGRCFSYANYEPASWAFRVRAIAANPYVVARPGVSSEIQNGRYTWQEGDLPAYRVDVAPSTGSLFVIPAKAGSQCGNTSLQILPRWTWENTGGRYTAGSMPSPGRG